VRASLARPRARFDTRSGRWLARASLVVLALLALTGGSALALVASLGQPWLKPRIRALARRASGLEVDYDAVHVSASGLTFDGLVLRSPVAVRAHAPALLRVGQLRAAWSAAELRHGPWLRAVTLAQVALTVVVDEHGKSSFDAIPSQPGGPPRPPTPLSQQAGALLGKGFPLQHLTASDVSVTLVRTVHDQVRERLALEGLTLTVHATATPVGTRLAGALGDAPVTLSRQRVGQPEQAASLRVELAASATASSAQASLVARVLAQSMVAALQVDVLAALQAEARFEPTQQRTEVRLAQLALVDRALTAEATVMLPDHAAPSVLHAAGDIDAVHLATLARAWDVPLRVGAGQLHYQIEELTFDRPALRAQIVIAGQLRGVSLPAAAGTELGIGAAQLSLQARPDHGTLRLSGEATLDGLRLGQGSERLQADAVRLVLAGVQEPDGVIDGQATLRFAALETSAVTARQGKLVLQVHELVADLAAPRQSHGELRLRGDVATVEARGLLLADAQLEAHVPLRAGAAYEGSAQLSSERLELTVDNGRLALPLHLAAHLTELAPDVSSGRLRLAVQAGALSAALDAQQREDDVDYTLEAQAAELTELSALLSASDAQRVPLRKMAVQLTSQGRVEGLHRPEPRLRQHTQIQLSQPALDDVSARGIALSLHSRGTSQRHEAQADLRVDALRRGDDSLGHEHIALTASLDRNKPSARLKVESVALPRTLLDVTLGFDRKQRVLHYQLEGHLSELSALSTLLSQKRFFSGVDVNELDVKLAARGRVSGVVRSIDARGIRLSPDLLRTAAGEASAEVTAQKLRWAEDDVAVSIPAAHWRMSLHSEGARRLLTSEVTAERVDAALGSRHVGISGLRDRTEVTVVGGIEGTLEHSQQLWARAVEQDFVPGYPVGDLRAVVRFQRQGDGLIKLSELRLDNPLGGTTLALSGGLELSMDEKRLSLRSTLTQDLTRLSNRSQELTGQGKLSLEAAVSSPNLQLFHAVAKLQLAGASIRLPGEHIALESMDGELPVVSDFIVDEQGVEVLRGAQINPYAAQRFADQHPLLGHRSFISIASVSTPWLKLAPFAANLEVVRNIVSLSQVEMGVRGGTITGNGNFEYNGPDSRLDANVRASNVASSHGERFDGNAALSIGIRERTVEGRADILRIGRRHLQDLLDLQDPLRADASMNQIRTALHFGYPDRVRLSFQHGFASAGVDFAGLARLIKLKDVRGIPLGPLMERVMSAVQPEVVSP
jgi:translocation and assembly module TamB